MDALWADIFELQPGSSYLAVRQFWSDSYNLEGHTDRNYDEATNCSICRLVASSFKLQPAEVFDNL